MDDIFFKKEVLYGKLTDERTNDIVVNKQYHTVTKPPTLHFHNHNELLYISQGKYKIYAPKRIYQGDTPCLIFFKRGVYHNSVRVDCEKTPFSCYVIKFTSEVFEEIPEMMLDKKVFADSDVIIVPLNPQTNQRLNTKFEELYELHNKKDAALLRMMYAYLTLILNQVVYAAGEQSAFQFVYKSSKDFYIGDVIKSIMEITGKGECISVSELAERFFVSNSKLSKDFLKISGLNIKTFITELQLEQINKMLKKGMTNKEIVERCGFSGESYFIRFYRKHIGVTPGNYRRIHNREAANDTKHTTDGIAVQDK